MLPPWVEGASWGQAASRGSEEGHQGFHNLIIIMIKMIKASIETAQLRPWLIMTKKIKQPQRIFQFIFQNFYFWSFWNQYKLPIKVVHRVLRPHLPIILLFFIFYGLRDSEVNKWQLVVSVSFICRRHQRHGNICNQSLILNMIFRNDLRDLQGHFMALWSISSIIKVGLNRKKYSEGPNIAAS